MIIDKTNAESYFANRSLNKVKDHWVYRSIVRGQNLLKEPDENDFDSLQKLYASIVEAIDQFKPWNLKAWVELFGSQYIPKDIVVYLVVGLKDPYGAFALNDKIGNHAIIIDVAYLLTQVDPIEDFLPKFLTHEIAHIIIHRIYPVPYQDLPQEYLKYIMFDEGIAHFLSYSRDSLMINWMSLELSEKREKSYGSFMELYQNIVNFKMVVNWKELNQKPFWDQPHSTSGLFAISDYFIQHRRSLNCLKDIMFHGPDCLFDIIKKTTYS